MELGWELKRRGNYSDIHFLDEDFVKMKINMRRQQRSNNYYNTDYTDINANFIIICLQYDERENNIERVKESESERERIKKMSASEMNQRKKG